MNLTVVILTKDEAIHIGRAIRSVASVADRVVVVDSGSSDDTSVIARGLGAEVLTHPFVTQATQFNWALLQLPQDTDWIFRLDADEVVSPELAEALRTTLPALRPGIAGAEVQRRIAFMGHPIRWGGLFPVPIVRVLRHGLGRSEDRWMDEHILVDGDIVRLEGELLDDNLKPVGFWIDKHNAYASREVIDILNLEHNFMPLETIANMRSGQRAGVKRWLKEKIYAHLPIGGRALFYFLYRYVICLGFLDGRAGTAFHVLQGFWYRYLVDLKLQEVKATMQRDHIDVIHAIQKVLEIDLVVSGSSCK